MTALDSSADSSASPRRRSRWLLPVAAALLGLPLLASWWFTEPLVDHPSASAPAPASASAPAPASVAVARAPDWPEGRLDGDEAKRLLLASLEFTAPRLAQVSGYTATFRKQERMAGQLGPVHTMAMKVRNRPFAIYFKFLAPKAGKEVVYAEGHHDNKLIAHNGDWTRRLVPRLAVPPDSKLAMADSRHPITEAGLVNLANRLLVFRGMDIVDDDAVTILDRVGGPDGRPRLRSIHTHTVPNDGRPFARVEVLYDPETQYPIQISSYDWPEPGRSGDLKLAERYTYDDLKLDAPLTAADFDPTNPDYAFMRF